MLHIYEQDMLYRSVHKLCILASSDRLLSLDITIPHSTTIDETIIYHNTTKSHSTTEPSGGAHGHRTVPTSVGRPTT